MDPLAVGEFLTARRARLTPQECGLPVHGRRATAGLRRAEVAVLAGVSVDYYTRLEQGRHPTPSVAVIEALARALRLDDAEGAHLHRLAGQSAPRPAGAGRPVRPQTRAVLDALQPTPAWLLGGAMDILAWNPAMARVVVDPARFPPDRRNFAVLAFTEPDLRARYPDWPDLAREIVATLHDSASRYPAAPRLAEVVDHLARTRPAFARAWARHDVAGSCMGTKRLLHPEVGELTLHHESLALDHDGQRIVTYLPADDTTAERLSRLTRLAPPGGPGRLRSVG